MKKKRVGSLSFCFFINYASWVCLMTPGERLLFLCFLIRYLAKFGYKNQSKTLTECTQWEKEDRRMKVVLCVLDWKQKVGVRRIHSENVIFPLLFSQKKCYTDIWTILCQYLPCPNLLMQLRLFFLFIWNKRGSHY